MAVNADISFSSAPIMKGGTLWQLPANHKNTLMMKGHTLQTPLSMSLLMMEPVWSLRLRQISSVLYAQELMFTNPY